MTSNFFLSEVGAPSVYSNAYWLKESSINVKNEINGKLKFIAVDNPAMATSPFIITEYIVDGQHVREYPRATRTGDDVLKLAVKRYTPKSNPNPQPGDVTIIGAHGSGFPKVRHREHIGEV